MGFFSKIKRPLDKGSLRGVVLLWITMTMGVGVLTLPALVKEVGITGGFICMILAANLCNLSYKFIFEASIYTKIKDYTGIV